MAKKKKVDVEVKVNDASLEIHKDETTQEVILDTKNLSRTALRVKSLNLWT